MNTWSILASAALWMLACSAALAQDTASVLTDGGTSSTAASPPLRPLSGAQLQPTGGQSPSPGLIYPFFSLSELVSGTDTNADCQTAISADIRYTRNSSNGSLELNYNGGALLHSANAAQNNVFQNVSVDRTFIAHRWTFTLDDTFSYLPQAPLGNSSGIAGLGQWSPGLAFNNVNPNMLPNNSILLSDTSRISNSVYGQMQYHLTRATSITGTTSYGLLHYLGASTLNSHQEVFSTGLNHEMRRSQVALQYQYSRYSYEAIDDTTDSQMVQLMYSRSLGRNFTIDTWIGPQFVSTHGIAGAVHQVASATSVGMSCTKRQNHVQLRYLRSTNGGSGLLLGALSDEITLGGSRAFHHWSVSTNEEYVINRGLSGWQRTIGRSFGGQVSFDINRTTGAYFSYAYRSQSASNVCVGGACAFNGNQHTGGMGIYWHPRGWRFDN